MKAVATPPTAFYFDKEEHRYFLGDEEIPHITQMLTETGHLEDWWFTDESSERGQMVHRLAAEYDLGAIPNPRSVECVYKGWFLAHVAAMLAIRHRWTHVETAMVSPTYLFGGRPDRVGKVWGAWAVVDLKTGVRSKATPIQTALQAILAAPELRLPPTAMVRYELDLKKNGKFALLEHPNRSDFDEAYEVIRKCCRPVA